MTAFSTTQLCTVARTEPSRPPVDTENPDIITFLTVPPGIKWSFAISPRPASGSPADRDTGVELLVTALATIGIGAKTTVGYGRFH